MRPGSLGKGVAQAYHAVRCARAPCSWTIVPLGPDVDAVAAAVAAGALPWRDLADA